MHGIGMRSFLVGAVLLFLPKAVFAQGTSNPTVRDSSVGYIDSALPGDQFRAEGRAQAPHPAVRIRDVPQHRSQRLAVVERQ